MGRESAEKRILTSTQLRREIHGRNLERGAEAEREVSWSSSQSVIFLGDEEKHGNFLPAAYARILANPEWKRRLKKSYTASRFVPRAGDRRRYELECASSSDALLMNLFSASSAIFGLFIGFFTVGILYIAILPLETILEAVHAQFLDSIVFYPLPLVLLFYLFKLRFRTIKAPLCSREAKQHFRNFLSLHRTYWSLLSGE